MVKIMNKCKIYLVRHGQSLGNVTFTFLGHTDLDLSEMGYLQAEKTAEYLSDVNFDAVYSSDLLRAFNTALPNARKRGLPVIARTGLREIFVGEWENMTCADIEEKYGDLYRVGWLTKYGEFAFPGGESTVDAGVRFCNELTAICKENIGRTILVAAHGAVIRSFWAIILGVEPCDISEKVPFATNASISVAEFDGEKFTPVSYSSDSHLSEVGITKLAF